MDKIKEGLNTIHESIVKYVLDYLKTGIFLNKNTNSYMTAYQ